MVYISIKYLLCDFYLYFRYHTSSLAFEAEICDNIYSIGKDVLLHSIYIDQNLAGKGFVASNN
jgi:hypothetical protein